jgi:hypothetical protein
MTRRARFTTRAHTVRAALRLRRLEERTAPAVVFWDGGGNDLAWTNALNWSTDAVPGPNDDVFLDVAGNFTVGYGGGATVIKSLTLSDPLQLKLGSIEVTGATTIGPGASIIAQGFGVSFQANGPTVADSANIYALEGGRVALPGLSGYKVAPGLDSTIYSRGVGSVIELPGLTTFTGAGSFRLVTVWSLLGGHISMPALASVSAGYFDLRADGGGSRIDLPALSSVSLGFDYATMTAINNGTLHCPLLTKINRVGVTVADTATMPLGQVSDLNSSSVTALNGATVVLPALTGYHAEVGSPVLVAQGTTSKLQFPNLTTLKGGGSFYLHVNALSGGVIDFPALPVIDTGYVELKADGANSQVNIPGLTAFAPPTDYGTLTATNAGTIGVPSLTKINRVAVAVAGASGVPTAQVTDLTAASVTASAGATVSFPGVTDYASGSISPLLSATGASSRLQFPNLATIKGGGTSNYLRFHALAGGRIELPAVATAGTGFIEFKADGANSRVSLPALTAFAPQLEFGTLTASAGGTVDAPVLTKINRVVVTVSGTGALPTAQITDVNQSYLTVSSGAKVAFPGVASFDSGPLDSLIQVTGSGSLLQFPNLTSLKGPSGFTFMNVLALTGGRLEMPALPTITTGNVTLRSENSGSFMWLPNLSSFVPVNETGRLTVTDSATISAPNLATLYRVTVTISDKATFPTAQIAAFDTSSVFVNAGAKVSLPGLTAYQAGPNDPFLQASGPGSVLTFPNLTSLKGATQFRNLRVNGLAGGRVELPVLPSITTGVVEFRADGAGSVVDLSGLQSWAPDNDVGTGLALNAGSLWVPQLKTINKISVTVSDSSVLPAAQITDFTGSSVFATNGAAVSLSGLTTYVSGPNDTTLRADGGGSVLGFPNLTAFKGSTLFRSARVQATNGGRTQFPALTTIDTGTVDIRSDGGNSVMDLPALTAFAPLNDAGTVVAINGGAVAAPLLTTLRNVTLTISDSAAVPTAQMIDISAASVFATNGAVVSFPGITAYESGPLNQTLQAGDSGSRLSFPNLTSLKGSGSFNNLRVNALAGGRVDFPVLSAYDTGSLDAKADGGGSVLDFSALQFIAPSADFAKLTVSNTANVLAPQLTKLNRTTLTVSSYGVLPMAQISNIDRSSVAATDGGQIRLPSVTAYAGGDFDTSFTAQGSGSIVQLINLATLKGATNGRFVRAVAQSYGTLDVPALVQIDTGAIEIRASGAVSVVNMPSLKTFAPAGDFGQLTVEASGKFVSQPALGLQRVTLTTDPTSQFTLASLDLGTSSLWTGTGTLKANVTNGGDIRPGGSSTAGNLTVDGNYVQTAAGRVSWELYGVQPITQHDRLTVTGSVSVGGTLGYFFGAPTSLNDSFIVIENAGASPVVGQFANLPEGSLILVGADAYTLSYLGGNGNDVTLTRSLPGAPRVQWVQVNDGSAQRSRVTSLTVAFDQAVNFATTAAAAFQLTRQLDGQAVSFTANVSHNPTTTVTLTFNGGAFINGSLIDGRYTLTVLAGEVGNGNGQLDGNADGTGGEDYVHVGAPGVGPRLFRLFADSDGDGDVDAQDFSAFRAAFGLPGSTYDSDGDGDVDAADFAAFRARFGTSV